MPKEGLPTSVTIDDERKPISRHNETSSLWNYAPPKSSHPKGSREELISSKRNEPTSSWGNKPSTSSWGKKPSTISWGNETSSWGNETSSWGNAPTSPLETVSKRNKKKKKNKKKKEQ
ncbi:unnamed protein product [Rhizophagus irregularis]|uniref:Uncharacterized protein n=1 Tax=Rhizophagus irregularis TaxID=588596 RepID=A0A2I1GSI2_9GLOM|nr:hypothetical protein RhiirA4_248136 [Rhizophagus irregularis]CAB4421199.1 unnamed protein product [Rhizophagus irregularis]